MPNFKAPPWSTWLDKKFHMNRWIQEKENVATVSATNSAGLFANIIKKWPKSVM